MDCGLGIDKVEARRCGYWMGKLRCGLEAGGCPAKEEREREADSGRGRGGGGWVSVDGWEVVGMDGLQNSLASYVYAFVVFY